MSQHLPGPVARLLTRFLERSSQADLARAFDDLWAGRSLAAPASLPSSNGSRDGRPHRSPSVAIIGAGFGGVGLGISLKQAGFDSFTILEKAERIGGVWRDNTYPGATCDVPSHLYSSPSSRTPTGPAASRPRARSSTTSSAASASTASSPTCA